MFSELFISGITLEKGKDEHACYALNLPCIKNLNKHEFKKRVTFFVGENGTGKSTLLEAIAVNAGFNAEGGTRNFTFSTKETHSGLYKHLKVIRGVKLPKDGFFLRAESFYNVATEVDRLDDIYPSSFLRNYGGKSLHDQSHGESFMSLVMNRFKGNSLYILDEPEAALSPSRQLSLLILINELVRKNSQFIIATHSPILMAFPDSDILYFSEGGLELKKYEETEHYIVTKQFLNNPQKVLDNLFIEEDDLNE